MSAVPALQCPVCGGQVPDDGRVLVDIDGRMVLVGHSSVQLTPTEMATFEMLWRSKPIAVSKERLLHATSKAGYDDDREIQLVAVLISNIRRKIKPLGLRITNVWNEGYRIDAKSTGAA